MKNKLIKLLGGYTQKEVDKLKNFFNEYPRYTLIPWAVKWEGEEGREAGEDFDKHNRDFPQIEKHFEKMMKEFKEL